MSQIYGYLLIIYMRGLLYQCIMCLTQDTQKVKSQKDEIYFSTPQGMFFTHALDTHTPL